MKIQILHSRDPDSACDLVVYVDGVLATDVQVEDIDPGRGYTEADWQERIDGYKNDPTAFGQQAERWLTEASGSTYITKGD